MAGYADTRQMIIDTLTGRMAGTKIQPEDHQAFALKITDYIRSVELVAGNATPIGFADANTVPVQPDNGQAVYLSAVGGAQTVTFGNFIDQNGNSISVTSTANVIKLVTLLWNGQYWSSQVTSVNAVRDTTDGYLFMGVATPSTNPGTPDQKVFYLAGAGTYANFGGKVITAEIGVLKYDSVWNAENLNPLYNRFGLKWISDTYLHPTNGLTIDSPGRYTSSFFPVIGGKNIIFSNLETDNKYVSAIAFYDVNHFPISAISNIGPQAVIYSREVPANAVFARVGVKDQSMTGTAFILQEELIYNSLSKEPSFPNNIEITNYAILAEIKRGYYYDENGRLKSTVWRSATNLLPLDKSKPLYLLNIYTTSLVFFDKDKNFISRIDTYPGAANYPFSDYPDNAVYMAIDKETDSYTDDELFAAFSTSSRINPSLWQGTGRTLKIKNIRPVININLNDDQISIYYKMVDAAFTGDCDVVFESGEYNFNETLYNFIYTITGRIWGIGLPIGNGCRYYFQNSKLITDTSNVTSIDPQCCNLLDFVYVGGNYELHDAILVQNGYGYIVHDEGIMSEEVSYYHKYENIKFISNAGVVPSGNLSKCIGGGAGKNGSVEIINCVFIGNETNPDISWHGLLSSDVPTTFRLSVANSYFKKGISLDGLRANETGIALISACSLPQDVSVGSWEVYKISNTIRND